jgi:filamentous hemagglutinin family protein
LNTFRSVSTGAAVLIAAGVVRAEVVFDGTLGPAGALSGIFEISNTQGTQVGGNLFHSFATFNINAGERATFRSDFAGTTTNVIGRVTGGALSTIDGVLSSTISDATLWIINPQGVVFGAGAMLDVDGGFHASTADFLLLEDGSRFTAAPGGGTTLTVANPAAFGFLDATIAPITGAAAVLEVGEGERLSLVGGDVTLDGTELFAPNGVISVGSVAGAGTLSVDLAPQGIGAFGAVTLRDASVVTSAASGGKIQIRGGQFVMDAGSYVTANTEGADAANRGGDILLDVDAASILNGSQISSTTFGAGAGGRIALTAARDVRIEGTVDDVPAGVFANVRQTASGNGGRIELSAENLAVQGGLIGSVTFGAGNAGAIDLNVRDTLTIRSLGDADGAVYLNSLSTATGGVGSLEIDARRLVMNEGYLQAATVNGASGNVAINVDTLAMSGGSQITTGTTGPGPGGSIIVNARDASLSGLTAQGFPTGIFANSNFPASGPGGDLVVNARALRIAGGAQLAAGASGSGRAGTITVNAAERVVVDGEGLLFPRFTGIFVNTFSNANAGSIRLAAPTLELRQGGALRSGSFAANPLAVGAGGDITVDVGSLTIDAAFIEGRTETSGNGGNLFVNVTGTMTLGNSTGFIFTPGAGQPIGGLLTSAGGLFNAPQARGSAGDMTINVGELVFRDGGVLSAATFLTGGNAGNIVVNAGTIGLDAEASPLTGIFNTSSSTGRAGAIRLDADAITIGGPASINAAAFAAGDAGTIAIAADDISIHSGGSVLSNTLGGGAGGAVSIAASGTLTVDSAGRVTAATTGPGRGGSLVLSGSQVAVSNGGTISASATGTGNAGTVTVAARERLDVNGGAITASAARSAGGNIELNVGDILFADSGTISAAAQGVTAQDSGGNVTIDPEFVVLRGSDILASANAGNGGNIAIHAGTFVIDTTSTIDASSTIGLDGEIAIDSPNEITGELIPLAPPAAGINALISQRCAPVMGSQLSSLTAEPVRSPASPADYLPSPIEPLPATVASSAAFDSVLAHAPTTLDSCYGVDHAR